MPRTIRSSRAALSAAVLATMLGAVVQASNTDTPVQPNTDRVAQPERAEPETAAEHLSDEQRAALAAEKFDLDKNNLAIKGYDPVSYFPEGGAKPAKGSKKFEFVRDGVRYRFTNAAHRDLFKADPEKYAPAYGGWCAYAMAKDDYTAPNPKRFLIQNGRLMLFYDGFFGDTYKKWNDEGPELLEPLADQFWMSEIEGEAQRIASEKDG